MSPLYFLESTAVTNLKATATSFESILMTWDLPLDPNGPIAGYRVFHRQSDTTQSRPISSNDYTQNNATERQFKITGLTVFTSYSIHVQAIGSTSNQGNQAASVLLGDIDEEVLQITHEASEFYFKYGICLKGNHSHFRP